MKSLSPFRSLLLALSLSLLAQHLLLPREFLLLGVCLLLLEKRRHDKPQREGVLLTH
ncbi:MAG: hypothetical protein IAE77_00135 [Prosthecobacter sp.]|nr:hypothetical protein [Prosthecobacter sp.]